MVPAPAYSKLHQSLTRESRSFMVERTESLLLNIIRANFDTQYASKAAPLAEFRAALSNHGSGSNTTLIQDFRRWVPLSDYDAYKPFMAVFDKQTCKQAEVENLFAPGLPSFLAISSATSGKAPKLFPKYRLSTRTATFDPRGHAAVMTFHGYREVKEVVEHEQGQIMKKIPVSTLSAALSRVKFGWANVDGDDSRMSSLMPGFVAPWAASTIKYHKSFLIIHALFCLACRDLDCISTTFSALFYDLVQQVDEEWDMLLSSIRNGTVPDLPGVDEVRPYLQAHWHANPERAAELGEIGRPSSCEGWAAQVWPKLQVITMICSGPFAAVLPKIKSVVGPNIAIRSPGYASSESFIAVPHRPDDLHTFVLQSNDYVEFLDVTTEESHENVFRPWELEVGKRYEIVLTTNDGLWRYRLGDIVEILGFDADTGSPVFAMSGRRSLAIRLPALLVTDTHLSAAIQSVSPDIMDVNEFTTVLDDRQSTQTVGFFVESAGMPGPNAHLAPLRLAEGLAAVNPEFQGLLQTAKIRLPTVHMIRPGTFSEYRQWRAEKTAAGSGQVKLPVVLLDPTSIEWIMNRVVGELRPHILSNL